ncbi:MAG: DNA polymerase I [Desulfotalea sp.]
MAQKNIYVIDGSAYIYRAYHAVVPLSNSKGVATNATLGFVNMINKLIKDKEPQYIVVAFDSRGPVFRHEMYKEYKANRPPMPEDLAEQIPYIKKFVLASGIPLLEQVGVEADDIIGSIAKLFSSEDCDITIVTGDKDLLQIVDDTVKVFDPMKDKIMDSNAVIEKYGVRPDQLLDAFAMIGDSSDNVPGVPGVGPKTAQKLIAEHGSLDTIYENVGMMKKSKMKEKIIANKDLAYLSKDLIRLKTDVEIPVNITDYLLTEEKEDDLQELFTELEFKKFLTEPKAKPIDKTGFVCVQDEASLDAMLLDFKKAKQIVVDTETTSLDTRKAKLVGISLSANLEKSYYIPISHLNEEGERLQNQLEQDIVINAIESILTDESVLKIGHNLKYDWTVLKVQTGLEIHPLADTMVAAHLLEVGRSLKLDDLCLGKGIALTSFETVVNGDKREDAFSYVSIEGATAYSCEDVYACLTLWDEYRVKLKESNLESLFFDIEMKLISILAEMEIQGICLDESVLAKLSTEFAETIENIQKNIFSEVGHDFNLNSPKQLGVVLFEELGLPHGRKTKTGYSTDVKVLEKLAVKNEIAATILRYRTIAKLKSTYVDKLVCLKDQDTNKIYTSFNQTVTATGRLSSSNPNMQNIPIRMEEGNRIRQSFVVGEGNEFLSVDYSQIDLRVLAHYSQDEALKKAFLSDEDIHNRTAVALFNVSPLLLNKDMRRVAKSINFGIVYGMSAFGLSSQLDISRKEAQRFIDCYFHLYAGVKDFMGSIVEQAREDGYVTTLLGRRRILEDINAKNKNKRDFAERMAINTPIQGTAADIIKAAMIEVGPSLKESGLKAKMILQIHDELVFEVPVDEMVETKKIVEKVMENAIKLDVPLVVNSEVGLSLAK